LRFEVKASLAGLVGRFHAHDAIAFHEEAVDLGLLAHLGAFLARVVEQELVEFRAQHLPGLRDGFTIVAVEEIERLRATPVRLHERDAVFLHEVRLLHLRDHADPLQGLERERNERFADVITGKLLALEDQHAMAVFTQDRAGAGAGWSAANDDCVVGFSFVEGRHGDDS
jgi:hypothetical protein